MVTRHDLTDAAWARLEGLLPPEKPDTGRTANPHRPIVNGILWLKRTGAPWRDIPACYGNWSTLASRFYRWCKQGIWQRIWQTLQQLADAAERIDWQTHLGLTQLRACAPTSLAQTQPTVPWVQPETAVWPGE